MQIHGRERSNKKSATSDYFDNLKTISGFNLTAREFRRRHSLAIVLYHDTAREQILCDEKFLY